MKPITASDKRSPLPPAPAPQDSPAARPNPPARLPLAEIRSDAIAKFEAALEIHQAGGVGLKEIERAAIARFLAITEQPALAGQAPAPDAALANAVLRSNGEYWTIGFQGSESFIKNRKGLRYVADLVRAPGREIHALDLVRADRYSPELALVSDLHPSAPVIQWRPISEYCGGRGSAGPLLDRQAKSEYRSRVADLREQLQVAEAQGDEPQATRVEGELKALTAELTRAFGPGGRPRFAADEAERARVNVTRTIRLAIERIGRLSPDLGSHLDASIRTGAFCCYRPERVGPIFWRL